MSRHRKAAIRTAIGLLTMAAAGALLVSSGIVSIAASSGHWPLMNWFLHYAAQRSIFTHSLGVETPPPDDPALLRLGAVHYRLQCAGCHGAPGMSAALPMQHMTPPPPPLADGSLNWTARELFWIIKHGIKYTAMPAWPAARRDDDIWPVVMFLQGLPQLDRTAYARLSGWVEPLSSDSLSLMIKDCSACHGAAGEGSAGAPRLAGQHRAYLLASLDAYADGRRSSGMMQAVAAGLTQRSRHAVADYYSSLNAPAAAEGDASARRRGERIALRGIASQGVPPCIACHALQGKATNARYPKLAGQRADYMEQQLRLFRDDRRGGTSYHELMRTVARRLNEQQSADVATYYSAQPPPNRAAPSTQQAPAR
jgi:cytochrome c553